MGTASRVLGIGCRLIGMARRLMGMAQSLSLMGMVDGLMRVTGLSMGRLRGVVLPMKLWIMRRLLRCPSLHSLHTKYQTPHAHVPH